MEPKWVLPMGLCASSSGILNNYVIVQGVNEVAPVETEVHYLDRDDTYRFAVVAKGEEPT
jgi:hypothetical protein